MRVKIGGVALIPSRPLKINSVGQNLPVEFCEQNSSPDFAPARRAPEFGQQRAEVIKSRSLAGQIRVRAVRCRKVCFDVTRVQIQKFERVAENRFAAETELLAVSGQNPLAAPTNLVKTATTKFFEFFEPIRQ